MFDKQLSLKCIDDSMLLHCDVRKKLITRINKVCKTNNLPPVTVDDIIQYSYPKLYCFIKQKGYVIGSVSTSNLFINYWFIHPANPKTKVYFRDLVREAFKNNVYAVGDKFVHRGTNVVQEIVNIYPKPPKMWSTLADTIVRFDNGATVEETLAAYSFETLKEI